MKTDIFNTNKKYNIIYADPPWQYKVWNKNTGNGRSAESHYHTMDKADIESLPVPQLCEKDSVLLLWVTYPCLEQGLELIRKWGFKYGETFAEIERQVDIFNNQISIFDILGEDEDSEQKREELMREMQSLRSMLAERKLRKATKRVAG